MPAGRAAVLVSLAIVLSASPIASQGLVEVARALLDEARQAAGIGDWETASACLAEAAAQDSGDSDVLYLRALAVVKRDLPIGSALGYLDAALATGRFSYYARRDASVLKAELLVRERRWKEALRALDPPAADSAADPAYRLVRARAFAGLADMNSFIMELSSALRRFPDDPSFARLFLTRAGRIPYSPEARELGRIILGRLGRYSDVDSELAVIATPLMGDDQSRKDTVLAYRAAGGASAAATLRALEYGLIDEATAAAELFSGAYPVTLEDLAALEALAGSPAGKDAILMAISAWSGKIEVDSDGDGIAEGSFSVVKGIVTDWELDSRQEGMIDFRADFAAGSPSTLTLMRAGMEIDVQYASYPSVSSIAFIENGESRGYSFAPEALSFAPIALRPFAGEGKAAILFPYSRSEPDPSEHECAATALSVAVETPSSRSVTLLDKGIPISETVYAGGRILSTMVFHQGKPSLERIDADGDGRFETERGYYVDSDGESKPSWQRTDSDGDGVFEYKEQLVFPFRKEWDYDGNGSVDAAQFQLADGSIEEQFSSRLDGRLDEAVIVKDGKIASLSRDGISLDLLPDINPDLTWIGGKSFDLGRNLPIGEGIFSEMGRRYRLSRVGRLAFAELIP